MANELYHHGVLGMKWGVRRYQNRDGSYKSGAKGRYNPDNGTESSNVSGSSSVQSTSSESKSHRGLSDGQKKAIKVGVAVAGTALAAYGAYKFSSYVKSEAGRRIVHAGNEKAKALMRQAGAERNRAGSMGPLPGQMHRFQLYTKKALDLEYEATKTLENTVDKANDTMKSFSKSAKYLASDKTRSSASRAVGEVSKKNPLTFEASDFGFTGSSKDIKSFGEVFGGINYSETAKRYRTTGDEFTKTLLSKNLKDLEKLDLW